jgi:hypothetical protein
MPKSEIHESPELAEGMYFIQGTRTKKTIDLRVSFKVFDAGLLGVVRKVTPRKVIPEDRMSVNKGEHKSTVTHVLPDKEAYDQLQDLDRELSRQLEPLQERVQAMAVEIDALAAPIIQKYEDLVEAYLADKKYIFEDEGKIQTPRKPVLRMGHVEILEAIHKGEKILYRDPRGYNRSWLDSCLRNGWIEPVAGVPGRVLAMTKEGLEVWTDSPFSKMGVAEENKEENDK